MVAQAVGCIVGGCDKYVQTEIGVTICWRGPLLLFYFSFSYSLSFLTFSVIFSFSLYFLGRVRQSRRRLPTSGVLIRMMTTRG